MTRGSLAVGAAVDCPACNSPENGPVRALPLADNDARVSMNPVESERALIHKCVFSQTFISSPNMWRHFLLANRRRPQWACRPAHGFAGSHDDGRSEQALKCAKLAAPFSLRFTGNSTAVHTIELYLLSNLKGSSWDQSKAIIDLSFVLFDCTFWLRCKPDNVWLTLTKMVFLSMFLSHFPSCFTRDSILDS